MPLNSSTTQPQPAIATLPILTESLPESANPALSLEHGTIISRVASVLPTTFGQTHPKAANAPILTPLRMDTAITVREVKNGYLWQLSANAQKINPISTDYQANPARAAITAPDTCLI